MTTKGIATGIAVGGLLMAPVIGVSYLVSELFEFPFAPYDLFDWLARSLPGAMVTFGIDLVIDVLQLFGLGISEAAKTAERSLAVLLLLGVGAAVGGVYSRTAADVARSRVVAVGALIGVGFGLLMALFSIDIGGSSINAAVVILWSMGLFGVWGYVVGLMQSRLSVVGIPAPTPSQTLVDSGVPDGSKSLAVTRREFVVKVGASVAVITVASTAVGSLLARAARRELEAEQLATTDVTGDVVANQGIPVVERLPFPNAGDLVVAAPGTRPEYTATEDHYDVSLRTRGTEIDGATWKLDIYGQAANPISFTIADLRRDFEAHNKFVTLSCISGPVGARLMSTTQWTGLSLQDMLERIQPFESARYLDFTCADGFHEIIDIEHIKNDERIMLCYAWNGEPLPIDHGFPLRVWIPDRYGMKQPRWIESIEVTDKYREGYWVRRGWDAVARIEPTSAIDTVAKDAVYEVDGVSYVPVGGIAFTGTKGVSKVEVRVDDGDWQQADLRAPLSDATWVVWRYDWPFEAGYHEFEVRCVTGDGAPQAEDSRDVRPSGATGIHSVIRSL